MHELTLIFFWGGATIIIVMWCMKETSSEELESKTPSGPIYYEIFETHLHQGDDVGTSSGDGHVTHMSTSSYPVYDTLSQPGDIQLEINQAYGPPSGTRCRW